MTKQEMIDKYGLEYYNKAKQRIIERNKDNHCRNSKAYVKDGRIDLIENYELAKSDNFIGWDIHHKLEINDDYINTYKDLKLMNLYYNRPPDELIWLTHSEHTKLHYKYNSLRK